MNGDPGWRITWQTLAFGIVPQLAIRRAAKASEDNGLVGLRHVFVSFSMAVALVTVVACVLGDLTRGEEPTVVAAAVVAAAGIASLLGSHLIAGDLECASEESLRHSYQTRFFLRLAFSNAAMLSAFAIGISLGPWWIFFIGLVFTLIGFMRLAPTSRNLERDRNRLQLEGCTHDLVAVLQQSPNGDAG